MKPQMLSPLALQLLSLGLLWLMVVLLALRFVLALRRKRDRVPAAAAAPAPPAPTELLVETPPAGGLPARSERIIVGSQEVVIGRASGANLRVDDEFTSSRHAVIRRSSGTLTIQDLGSTNGTFLNDAPLTEPAALKSGDRVRIGKTTIRVL